MELAKIVDAYEALAQIKSTNNLPFKLAWKFSDIIESLEKHYVRYNEEKKKIVTALGEGNGDDTFKIPKENLDKFQKQMSEMLLHDIDLDINNSFDVADLIDANLVINKEVNLGAIRPWIVVNKELSE